MRAIYMTAVASSFIVASQNDANCEKSFTRGVEVYELGLQVGLHFAPDKSSLYLCIAYLRSLICVSNR
jgi:hypothetical protein